MMKTKMSVITGPSWRRAFRTRERNESSFEIDGTTVADLAPRVNRTTPHDFSIL
jgi:hypothetical protein